MNLISMCRARCSTSLRTRIKNERGASLVEYALLLGLIAVICVVAISFIGSQAEESFSETGSALAK